MAYQRMAVWGRVVLLVGIGLTALTAFEVGEAAFGAQEEAKHSSDLTRNSSIESTLRSNSSLIGVQEGAQAHPLELPTPPEDAIMVDAPPVKSIATATTTVPESEAHDVRLNASEEQASSGSAQAKTLAIDSSPANGNQPSVANISPEEFAIAAWAGASFPVENFQAYTSPFGYRRSPTGGYRQEFHYGLDLAAPQGSYIRSWWSGKVVELTDNTNCGTSIVIQSGDWTHIYCHMHGHVEEDANGEFLVDRDGGIMLRKGQQIGSGARIGRVGMTGRTTGPHLHWGLKYQGTWVDPALVLRAMYLSQRAAL
jgi:murein DD-endopeptidase MepM/ murein hydrolase activator NlpD